MRGQEMCTLKVSKILKKFEYQNPIGSDLFFFYKLLHLYPNMH